MERGFRKGGRGDVLKIKGFAPFFSFFSCLLLFLFLFLFLEPCDQGDPGGPVALTLMPRLPATQRLGRHTRNPSVQNTETSRTLCCIDLLLDQSIVAFLECLT